jgi:nucleoside-diphosphate-sugar epimerase
MLFMQALGWRASISLKEGLKKTYKWYIENLEVEK